MNTHYDRPALRIVFVVHIQLRGHINPITLGDRMLCLKQFKLAQGNFMGISVKQHLVIYSCTCRSSIKGIQDKHCNRRDYYRKDTIHS